MISLLKNQHVKRSLLSLLAAIFFFGILAFFHPFRRDVRIMAQTAIAHLSANPSQPFPGINTTGLTTLQRRVLTINRQQYAKQPVSYDAAVLTYTQGSQEAWCADYVSWVFQQAGSPFTNPNSGSWRIPGVYTLQSYFKAVGRFEPVGSYQPQLGDVALYAHGQGHAAIVLSRRANTITTIGGNETGRLRLDTRSETGASNYDLIGFGRLP